MMNLIVDHRSRLPEALLDSLQLCHVIQNLVTATLLD